MATFLRLRDMEARADGIMWFDVRMRKVSKSLVGRLPKNLKVGFLLEGMSGPPSGVWTRFVGLVRALSEAQIEIHVLGIAGIHDEVLQLPVSSAELRSSQTVFRRFFYRRKIIEEFTRAKGLHVVHLEAPPFLAGPNVVTVASIHDLRHFYSASRSLFTGEALYQIFLLRFHLRKISLILALSSWASSEIHRYLGVPLQKIGVVAPIVQTPELEGSITPVERKHYAVALGHLEPRKNLGVIVAASGDPSWPKAVELLIAGADQGSLEELATLNCSSRGKAVFLGMVSEGEKWNLLGGALAVLLPSVVEGFGIVGAEAPIAGAPVLVARTSSLEELAAHPFAAIDPARPKDWAKAVSVLAEDSKLREEILFNQRQLSASFSGEKVVSLLLDRYRTLIDNC